MAAAMACAGAPARVTLRAAAAPQRQGLARAGARPQRARCALSAPRAAAATPTAADRVLASARLRPARADAAFAPARRFITRTRAAPPRAAASASGGAVELPEQLFTAAALASGKPPSKLAGMLSAAALPAALLAALAFGLTNPAPGIAAKAAGAVEVATATVFVLMGLTLRLDDVRAAFSAKRAAAFGVLSCLALSPLLAPTVLRLGAALPPPYALQPAFLNGLALLLCVPTTLSTGVILAQQARANAPLALLLVVATNVLGVFTMPYALAAVFGAGAGAALDPATVLQGLARTILAPLAAGVAARAVVPGVARLADATRGASRVLQQACLVATPWMTISESCAQLLLVPPVALGVVVAAAAALHVTLLALNSAAVAVLRLGGGGRGAARVRRALVLVTAQKTLPVSVAVVTQLGNALGAPGLVLLPCVCFHLLQILIDSVLVATWRRADGL